jgi:toxin CcdB
MAQFDVHRNGGKNRESIPYVVVVPLVKAAFVGEVANPRFNPTFKIGKTAVVLHPLAIVSVSNEVLGKAVTSLAADGDRIVAALDELLTRAWN